MVAWTSLNEETPTPPSDQDPADIGISYILQQLNIQPDEFTRRTNFTDRFGVTHLYGIPLHQGLLIEDLHAAVHIKNGQVFFYSATTIVDDHVLTKRSPTIPESTVEMSSEDAVKAAVDCLKVPFYPDIAPVKESYKTENGNIFVWGFQLRDNSITQWIEVKVDAITGGIVSKEDFKMGFTYTAIELPNESFNDGFSTILNPENLKSSPNEWTESYKLKGNNVLVKFKRGKTLKTTTKGMFDGAFDFMLPPQTPKNLVAGAVNAFYAANMVHDVLYPYGFNELAGNFQMDSFNKDLHIYTATEPNRDSALDNNVMIHELTHGLSTRLTGGAHEDLLYWNLVEEYGFSANLHDATQKEDTLSPKDFAKRGLGSIS
ncbi:hypothetical protein BSLG_010842 [Batrachochytrium salamandrivorans]|nr:hypothetical protein BSLG_010842 [Batrachochytrium salamandrivorans]